MKVAAADQPQLTLAQKWAELCALLGTPASLPQDLSHLRKQTPLIVTLPEGFKDDARLPEFEKVVTSMGAKLMFIGPDGLVVGES